MTKVVPFKDVNKLLKRIKAAEAYWRTATKLQLDVWESTNQIDSVEHGQKLHRKVWRKMGILSDKKTQKLLKGMTEDETHEFLVEQQLRLDEWKILSDKSYERHELDREVFHHLFAGLPKDTILMDAVEIKAKQGDPVALHIKEQNE
jgi:hypothetical protein